MQRIYSLLNIVVISLKQEVSKHNQLLSLFLSFCLTNLCPHFQIFWVVEAHKIQDTTHTKSYMRTKSARQTPVKAVAMLEQTSLLWNCSWQHPS